MSLTNKVIKTAGANKLATAPIALLLLLLLVFAVSTLLSHFESQAVQSRVDKLEQEKADVLKQRDEARAHDSFTQGQIKAKDEQIDRLNEQISESNARILDAHNKTTAAAANYNNVRTAPPHFDSTDDAGRALELQSELQRLYPDSP